MIIDKIIKNVYPKENYIIICEFADGTKKRYDVKKIIKQYKAFNVLLNNKNLFNRVKVDIGGYGIVWDEKIDLASEEIWENGKIIN